MLTSYQALAAILIGKLDIKSEKGATAVEYGIMVAAIAAVIVTIVFTLGQQILDAFTDVSDAITAGPAAGSNE